MIARIIRAVVGFASLLVAIRVLWPKTPEVAQRSPDAAPTTTGAASPSRVRSIAAAAVLLLVAAGIGGGLVVVSGVVPIKASSGHWAVTETFLQFAKRRSVSLHSWGTRVPPFDDPALVQKGAGHFEFGCRPCHGSPGLDQPRVAAHMTPRPPDLRRSAARYDPEDLFYIVKHGIKLTGMPAWPAQRRDDEVWAIVAFVRTLPELEPAEYTYLATGRRAPSVAGEQIEDLLGARHDAPPILGSCARCHGADGLGRGTGAFPRLAGQRPLYLAATLRAYARAERHSGIMEPLAAGLDTTTTQQIAEYFSRQRGLGSLPAAAARGSAAIELGKAIATEGLGERVPACASCHGPGARRRNPHYPRLAGQYADYIVLQLSLFKTDRRGGTAYASIMRKVAQWLTDEQMRAVAEYYATLSSEDGPVEH